MMGMMADKYMAKFKMLVGRANFNEAALGMHSSEASLSQWFSRSIPRPHYHLAWTTGRPSFATSTTFIRDLLKYCSPYICFGQISPRPKPGLLPLPWKPPYLWTSTRVDPGPKHAPAIIVVTRATSHESV